MGNYTEIESLKALRDLHKNADAPVYRITPLINGTGRSLSFRGASETLTATSFMSSSVE
jgi:hypothetical protein